MESTSGIDFEEETMIEYLLSIQLNKNEEELEKTFYDLSKTKKYIQALSKLNTITPLITNAKSTNLDAINEINEYFYENSANLALLVKKSAVIKDQYQEVTIGDIKCLLYDYNEPKEASLSFRILFFDDNNLLPQSMKQNSYLINNNEKIINKDGYLYAFGNNIMTDTYISTIIKILSEKYVSPRNYIDNYITFFINDNGYQIKKYYELSLKNFLDTVDINEELITNIIRDILDGLLVLKSNEYGFVHGNLITDNIFVKKIKKKYVFNIGNFKNSSIFYNGIRFANRNTINEKNLLPEKNGYYTVVEQIITNIPLYASYDVYIFMLSLLMEPNIFNFFNKNYNFFKNIYSQLFTESDLEKILNNISLQLKDYLEKRLSVEETIDFLNETSNKIDKNEILNNLNKLDYDIFNTKYISEYTNIYFSGYFYGESPLHKSVRIYYESKNNFNIFTIIKNLSLKENINDFYNFIIGTNPSEIIIDTNNLPYKRYPGRYFQISTISTFQKEYHLCIDKCMINEKNATNPTCTTNKYTSKGSTYIWDYCNPSTNVYELMQYKIVSRVLSYYNTDGTINYNKLNNDPNWRILLNMIIDNKLMVPHFDCKNDFILRGKLLPVTSASRSRQFININLDNIYDTLQLTHNNIAIDAFIDNITINSNEKYVLKPVLLKLIMDIISTLNKQTFAKINAVSNALLLDPYNNFIDNEYQIYQITNKLLYNNNTPNISSMITSGECLLDNANIYNNYLIEKAIKLGDYFENTINQVPLRHLYSYKIFVLELLNTSISLESLIYQYRDQLNQEDFINNFIAIMVQIAYTLECFNRIGLIHNDLHTGNIFVERLLQPINFQYILTDRSGEKIIKIFNIRTNYFIRIFDFDRSYTYPVTHKYLSINIESIAKPTSYFVENNYSGTSEATKYDFSYLCRWILYQVRNIPDGNIIEDIVSKIIGTKAYNIGNTAPVKLKNLSSEIELTREAMEPFEWLNSLDKNNEIIDTKTDIRDIDITNDTYIYILPDTFLDGLSNLFDQNAQWTNKTIEQKIIICPLIIKNFESEQIITKLNNLCKIKSAIMTIDWVRHGESCANYDQGIIIDMDQYPKRRLGYLPYEQNFADKAVSNIGPISLRTQLKAGWKYEPNLSYIGMQHAILLGINYIKKQEPYNIILCSPLTRTITTALLACRGMEDTQIYVVPYISEVQNVFQYIGSDYQNVAVNSKTLKQRILFIKDWLENNWINNFDDIEIMNDLFKIREYLLDNSTESKKIVNKITNVLVCKPSVGKTAKNEFVNKYIECPNTINIILDTLKYLEENKFVDTIFYQKYTGIMKNLDNYKRGPPVNFKILEKYEKIYQNKITTGDPNAEEYNTRNPNIYKFYSEILPELINIEKPQSILCIAHGSLIRKIWQTKNPSSFNENKEFLKHMKNTHVFREVIDYDKSIFIEEYNPILVRTSYENFEELNVDVCRVETIKGILNYNLQEPTETYLGSFAKTLKNSIIPSTISIDKNSYDTKFYNEKRYLNINPEQQIITGGNRNDLYRKKYLKYKSKYLSLKKITNTN